MLFDILDSGKYSVNNAVRGELGRYPVMIKVLSNGLQFFQRLQNLPDSTPMKSSHQDMILQPQFFDKTSSIHKLDIVSEDSAAPSMTHPLNFSLWWSLTTSKHGWTQFIMVANYDHTPCLNVIFMPPPLGAGGIMFSGCPSVRPSEARNTLFWPVHGSVGPPEQP